MSPAIHWAKDNASAPLLYMALKLSNTSRWLAFGAGARRHQVSVPAADLGGDDGGENAQVLCDHEVLRDWMECVWRHPAPFQSADRER